MQKVLGLGMTSPAFSMDSHSPRSRHCVPKALGSVLRQADRASSLTPVSSEGFQIIPLLIISKEGFFNLGSGKVSLLLGVELSLRKTGRNSLQGMGLHFHKNPGSCYL